jgi:hypothetical protein
MKLKVTLAALALALAPGMAAAMCSWEKTEQSASNCPQGHSWDESSQTCIAPVSS